MKRQGSFWRVGAVSALALFIVLAPAARAQDDVDNRALLDRINQLESEVQDLSRKTNSRGYVPGDVTNSNGAGAAIGVSPSIETRLSALEAQMRDLTGQVERANYEAQQANANLDKLKSDLEVRLQQIEQHQGQAPEQEQAQNQSLSQNENGAQSISDKNSSPMFNPPKNSDTTASHDNEDAASLPPEELYNRAYSEMQHKDYDKAQSDFRDFLANNPDHALASNAQYWLGESYFARGDYKNASAVFAEAYQKYPKSAKAPDSLLRLALSLEQQNRTKDSCTVLRQLSKEYPTMPGTVAMRTETELKKLKCQ